MLNATDLTTFTETLRERGFPTESMRVDARGTLQVGPESYSGGTLPDDDAPNDSQLTTITGAAGDLELGPRLARGGHGDIFEARQRSLDRDVAAKRPRGPDASGGFATVMEARVIGALEHPNIVPVHTLGADEGGAPIIVMKRISGKVWNEALDARATVDENLHKHIELLVRICDALRYAHDRGVLHLDLKPGNVMVGDFGEAYLLDWGLARAIGPHAPLGMLQHDSPRGPIGTPGYMAPEMVDPDGLLDERTDVFLLGGLLCYILTGAPVQTQDTLAERLFAAALGRLPAFPLSAPDELVAVCRRALSTSPQERFQTVADFQAALREHLEHRAALDLLRNALGRLAALEAMMLVPESDQARREVTRLFTETRFGLQAALQVWPDYAPARSALERCLADMVEYELERGHVDAAAMLLEEMAAPPEHLVTSVRKLRAAQLAEMEALRETARLSDARFGKRTRSYLLVVVGLVAAATVLAMALLAHLDVIALTPRNLFFRHVGLAVVVALWAYRWRAALLSTQVNRVVTWLLLTGLIGLVVHWGAVWVLEVPRAAAYFLAHGLLCLIAVAGGATDPRILPGGAVFGVGAFVIAALPEYYAVLDAVIVLVAISLLAWFLRGEDPTTSSSDAAH